MTKEDVVQVKVSNPFYTKSKMFVTLNLNELILIGDEGKLEKF